MKKIIQRFYILLSTTLLMCSMFCVSVFADAPQVASASQGGGIKRILLALVCGIIIAFLVTSRMKGELKTVHYKQEAAQYLKKDSMHLSVKSDSFVRKELKKTERQKKQS